ALAAGLAAAEELGLGQRVADALRRQAAALAHTSQGGKDWAALLGEDSPWWFVLDRMLASDGRSVVAYLRVGPDLPAAERVKLAQFLEERVPGSLVTGWSQLLASLVPWARRQLLVFGGGVLVVVLIVLALVYRKAMDWLWHVAAMGVAGAGLLATLKLLDVQINLLNVLAFPLILGVGVDYGTHLLLAARHGAREVAGTLRAVTFSALTTAGGFGALTFAQSPALAGLGFLCAAGVLWCLASAFLILVPGGVFARGSRDG
ncbi:MAG: MMPL family transporter, partial [Terrimicrobiaceae bacterium]|nr:MMPL family transporter [Terrimicrobiaceae bacterium]